MTHLENNDYNVLMRKIDHDNSLIPLTLYIHFPWCVKKCPYCDFNSHTLKNEIPEKRYVEALLRDLEGDLDLVQGRPIQTIFMGGGTPSLFSGDAIKHVLMGIGERVEFEPNMEITLEANPGTVDQKHFEAYRAAGVNRLSLGVQSFQNQHLKRLGRIHNENAATKAIETAIAAGFDNFNIDLMYGLPEQTEQEALADLAQACTFNPTHLSWYQLTIEPNTLFAHQTPVLPHEDVIWQMQCAGQSYLKKMGFEQYEVSAYSKPNKKARHNLNYWEFGDYLGIGAGAHSKLTDLKAQKIIRKIKIKNPRDYLKRLEIIPNNFVAENKIVSNSEVAFEFMLNALRLYQEIPLCLFETRTFLNVKEIEKNLTQAKQKGFLEERDDVLKVTTLGRQFLNDLMALFL